MSSRSSEVDIGQRLLRCGGRLAVASMIAGCRFNEINPADQAPVPTTLLPNTRVDGGEANVPPPSGPSACAPGTFSATGIVPCTWCPSPLTSVVAGATSCDTCVQGYATKVAPPPGQGAYGVNMVTGGECVPIETALCTSCSAPTPTPGITDCGEAHESCGTSRLVPGGTFAISYNPNGGDSYNNSTFVATISGFHLDKYEVTVARFAKFAAAWPAAALKAGDGKHTYLNAGAGLVNSKSSLTTDKNEPGWDTALTAGVSPTAVVSATTLPATLAPNDPQPNLTWMEAYAFCIWDGGFLPSEAELAYAGEGGAEQRLYAWGSAEPTNGIQANFAASVDASVAAVVGPVGRPPAGAGRWGQLNLADNVMEWTLDLQFGVQTTYSGLTTPCVNCAPFPQQPPAVWGYASGCPVPGFCSEVIITPAPPPLRQVRGGQFGDYANSLRAANRLAIAQIERKDGIGVRCARAPNGAKP